MIWLILNPMKQYLKIACVALCVVAALSALAACEKKSTQNFTVDDPYVRATPQKVSAGYFTITNNTAVDDALVSITADWAGKIELHNIVMDGDVMNMVPVENIALPVKQPVELKSGGLHVMLFDLKDPLNVGDTRKATLHFAHAPEMRIEFKVKPITYKGLEHHH